MAAFINARKKERERDFVPCARTKDMQRDLVCFSSRILFQRGQEEEGDESIRSDIRCSLAERVRDVAEVMLARFLFREEEEC